MLHQRAPRSWPPRTVRLWCTDEQEKFARPGQEGARTLKALDLNAPPCVSIHSLRGLDVSAHFGEDANSSFGTALGDGGIVISSASSLFKGARTGVVAVWW